MKKAYYLLCTCLLVTACSDESHLNKEDLSQKSDYQLTVDEVKTMALNFLNEETKSGEETKITEYKVKNYPIPVFATKSTILVDEIIPVYELTTESNGQQGYSIVIGDSRIQKVLIAAKKGSPNDTIVNEPLRTYFREIPDMIYSDLIAYYNNTIVKNVITKMDVTAHYAFLPTVWSQYSPYNSSVPYLCPNNDGGRAPVGCVPLAIGQILAYHRTPSNLNWNSILSNQSLTTSSPQTVINQVADLLVEIGSRVGVTYECGGSSVPGYLYETKVPQTLTSYGFVFTYPRDFSISAIAWSLSYSRPVLMNGWAQETATSRVGHAWVCDAYKKHIYDGGEYYEYLNMNWGWGGDSNGFFYVSNPASFSTSYKGPHFWESIRIITDIRK